MVTWTGKADNLKGMVRKRLSVHGSIAVSNVVFEVVSNSCTNYSRIAIPTRVSEKR